MTLQELNEVCSEIKARVPLDHARLLTGSIGGMYLQWAFTAPDAKTGMSRALKGRKWYVSPHAVPSEIVTTSYLAMEIALRHELLEGFRYHDVRVFNPHTDMERLASFQAVAPPAFRHKEEE